METCAGKQPAEPAADDQHFHLVGERLTLHALDVRIVEEMGVLARHLDVLVVAFVTQPLVPFDPVLLAQSVGVESEIGMTALQYAAHVSLPFA